MEDNSTQPLLAHTELAPHDQDESSDIISSGKYLVQLLSNHSFFSSFIIGEDDIPPITGVAGFFPAFKKESSKLWHLAGPAILTSIFQYSLGAVTQTFAGHVGTLDLAAFSMGNTVIADGNGKCTGNPLRAGVRRRADRHARRLHAEILGYSSRIQFFANVYVHIRGTTVAITRAVGGYISTRGEIFAVDDPSALRLRDELSDCQVLASSEQDHGNGLDFSFGVGVARAVQLAAHAETRVGNCRRCTRTERIVVVLGGGADDLRIQRYLCLEIWYFTALILFAGYLKNAEISVDALSICMNILGWTVMVSAGFNAAISVRVSNELGAAHPRSAKFSVVVVVISSFLMALLISIALLIFQKQYPSLFSESSEVQQVVYELTSLLAFCIVLNNVQPALSGVAIGAGWQALVAYVNIACYYLFGVPLGLILGYSLKKGVQGIWCGMVVGTVVQTIILFWIVYKTNWNKEASIAAKRIKQWRGDPNGKEKDLEK
ncbi:hypothetical protein DH2020_003634 [Rehmannia glutinosa]|uniref:Protein DETOXIFICATION n=1 Tax=Rehmannia glutinosa TaxID=99300 RepID=A0ABR0XMA8_REHGL